MNNKKTSRRFIILCVFMLVTIAIIIARNCYIQYSEEQKEIAYQRSVELYNQALECIKKQKWEEAKDLLESVSIEVCPSSLRDYVDARLEYDPEDMWALKRCKRLLSYMVKADIEGFEDEINDFRKEVNDQYGVLRRQELKGTFPYVGMNAADLYYTELGEPYKVTEKVNIARIHRHYYYKYNGFIYVIFVASPADEKDIEENKIVMGITRLID